MLGEKGFAMMLDGDIMGCAERLYLFVEGIDATYSLYDTYQDSLQQVYLVSQLPHVAAELQKKERSFLQFSLETLMGRK